MKKPFLFFEKIKNRNLSVFYLIGIGLLFGAVKGFIQFGLNKKIYKTLYSNWFPGNDGGLLNFIFIFCVVVIPLLTLLIRTSLSWLLVKILNVSEVKLKRIVEIVCLSYVSCFVGLAPKWGGIFEVLLNAILMFLLFKSYFQIKNWKSILIALIISLIGFKYFIY